MKLRIHGLLEASYANGPGRRAVLWVQGCLLRCPGCFNPGTHSFSGGRLVEVDEIVGRIVALDSSIEGITISGGEPLAQYKALTRLLVRIRRHTALGVLLFTGYSWDELIPITKTASCSEEERDSLLACVDVVIAGRYDQHHRLANGLIGSANKTVHFLTSRYSHADLATVPHAEVVVQSDGSVVRSGIAPLQLAHRKPQGITDGG